MITINERTKVGKTLLELARLSSVTNKGIKINEKTPYNPKIIAKILQTEKKEGITKPLFQMMYGEVYD